MPRHTPPAPPAPTLPPPARPCPPWAVVVVRLDPPPPVLPARRVVAAGRIGPAWPRPIVAVVAGGGVAP